jgi:plastocyanin
MKKLVAVAALLTMVMVGCGGGSDNTDPLAGGNTGPTDHLHSDDAVGGDGAAPCSPSGTSLSITAKDIQFDKSCLAAPAGQAFTIKFDNNDALAHNVNIQVSHTSTEAFFSGEQITGPNKSITYQVKALAAGTYHFHCIVHPDQMNGSFVVK